MRRFAISPQPLTGVRFVSKLNSCGIIEKARVQSVSNWTWSPFCKQFAEIEHAPTLNIATGAPLCAPAAVFAQLRIDEALLLKPPKDKQVYEHCEIEDELGFVFNPTGR